MGNAAVFAAGRHAVMRAQGVIAAGEILPCLSVDVAKGRRQAAAAVLRRSPAHGPQRILQPLGQGHTALATQDHMAVF